MEKSTEVRHSLVVLTYTRPDLAQARISEITRLYSYRPDVELVVFDNGSIGPAMPLVLTGYDQHKADWDMTFRVVRIKDNRGFGGGWNTALSFVTSEIVYLISDDVQIYGDIIAPIDSHFRITPNPSIVGQQLLTDDTGWNRFGETIVPYLMGHFLAMERSTWEKLGGFDTENFHPYDFEDIDLSYRASQEDIGLVGMPTLPINHEVAGTIGYSDERFEHTVEMRARFAEKWGLPNVPERP